jgi:hypothetical protein
MITAVQVFAVVVCVLRVISFLLSCHALILCASDVPDRVDDDDPCRQTMKGLDGCIQSLWISTSYVTEDGQSLFEPAGQTFTV